MKEAHGMTAQHRPRDFRIEPLAAILLVGLLCGCAGKKTAVAPPAPQPPAAERSPSTTELVWSEVFTPAPAADITAVGNVFWVCGADEMIASSSDGGNTWKLRHQKANGQTLLHIAFANEKVGHAAGKGGLLLSTTNGGRTWKEHNAGDDVLAFSFADADNGIAVIGSEGDINRFAQPGWGPFAVVMDGAVKLTHNAGEHWEDIPALSSKESGPFTQVLAVASLDSSHYLMLRRNPTIEDAFVVTADAGRSWKVVHQRNDATDRELAWSVFVHAGEYWAFGMELLNRQQRGGYGVPLTLHSRDGETWSHGISGPKEFGGCNTQGCYMWDGAVETLYEAKEQYWNLPQDGSLSATWAIAGGRACTIGTIIQCGPAEMADKPQPRGRNLPHSVGQPFKVTNLPFAPDCVACGVKVVRLDPGMNWRGTVIVNFEVDRNGAVTELYENGAPRGPLGALIEDQVTQWRFVLPTKDSTPAAQRSIPIDVKCIDAPDVPTMDGCQLAPGKKPV
jgi:photosystem II stability/assembly factor-like uncharacterized protein